MTNSIFRIHFPFIIFAKWLLIVCSVLIFPGFNIYNSDNVDAQPDFPIMKAIAGFDEPTTISTSCGLLAILNTLTYTEQSGLLPITDDISIDGTVTLFSVFLDVPDNLVASPFCLHKVVSFEDKYGADGIILRSVILILSVMTNSSRTAIIA